MVQSKLLICSRSRHRVELYWRSSILNKANEKRLELSMRYHGWCQTFSPGGQEGGQGAGLVGADISHRRALHECMDDNWGGQLGGKARARGGSCPPLPPASPAHV